MTTPPPFYPYETHVKHIAEHLLDIVQVGVGGYVLGRSGEKIMREYKRKD